MGTVSSVASIVGDLANDVGTGINVQNVVAQIIASDSAPLTDMQNQETLFSNQTSALQNISSLLGTLQTSVQALTDIDGGLSAQVATSSNTNILTATGSSTAAPGTHNVVVNTLATTASAYTAEQSSNATLSGSFQIQMAGASSPTTITIDSANNNTTLGSLASYINNQGIGVTASVVSDANGSRLAIVSNNSGAANDFTISNDTTGLGFTKAVNGTNASATVDGIPVSSATNSIGSVIPGVTLNLLSAAPGTNVSVTVAPDTTQISDAISTFVSSYNAVVQAINAQYAVNSSSQQGVLADDSTLSSVQSELNSDVNFSSPSNPSFVNLASMGISMNDDGTLSVDSTTLNSAITTNYQDFVNFFQNSSNTGFAQFFNNDLSNNLANPATGLIALDLNGIASSQQSLADEISQFQANLTTTQQSLTDEFSTIDTTLQELPILENQVDDEFGTTTTAPPTTDV
jgi:flagellar hook-associated protein 2